MPVADGATVTCPTWRAYACPVADTVRIIHIDVPGALHKRVKVLATERDETLKALVTRAIERECDRLEKARDRAR